MEKKPPMTFEPQSDDDLQVTIVPAAAVEKDQEFAPPMPLFDEQQKARNQLVTSYQQALKDEEFRALPESRTPYEPNLKWRAMAEWKSTALFLLVIGLGLAFFTPGYIAVLPPLFGCGMIGYGMIMLAMKERSSDLLGDLFFPSWMAFALLPVAIILGGAVCLGLKVLKLYFLSVGSGSS
jgi:hypothetical protein